MLQSIYFGNMRHSDNIKDELSSKISKIESKYRNLKSPEVKVWLDRKNPKPKNKGLEEYSCSIIFTNSRKQFFVSKRNQNFHNCINDAVDTLERFVRKNIKRRAYKKQSNRQKLCLFI